MRARSRDDSLAASPRRSTRRVTGTSRVPPGTRAISAVEGLTRQIASSTWRRLPTGFNDMVGDREAMHGARAA